MSGGAYSGHAQLLALVETDHRALAALFESLGHLCGKADATAVGCTRCPAPVVAKCDNMLNEITAAMLTMLLEHFEREDALMQQVAVSPVAQGHCVRHRNAHADFTTRYNRIATAYRTADVCAQIRAWKAFIHDWAREHALKFDAELARLAHGLSPA